VALLPYKYALTPAAALLTVRIIDTALITAGIKPNPYMEGVLMKKTTAQPLDVNGDFAGPGQEKIAILLLGAKSNHPLGLFAPDFGTVGEHLEAMTHELESETDQDTGCKCLPSISSHFNCLPWTHALIIIVLGQTGWQRKDANGADELLFISYWRSINAVHAYAHGPLHRKAWNWWESTIKKHNAIGFMHEVFEADKGQWEAVYINFQPTTLGATTYLRRNGKTESGTVADEWVSPLLDANKGKLRTSAGRRGQVHAAADQDKFGRNVYVEWAGDGGSECGGLGIMTRFFPTPGSLTSTPKQ
jgi:hypothetical protein